MKTVFMTALLCAFAGVSQAADIRFDKPVERYGHNILGDIPEWSALCVGEQCMELPEDRIFEDIAPRVIDLDGDDRPEIVVVETQFNKGASLAIYDLDLNKIASTPHIGLRNRWLAPIGAIDLDQDGDIEIGYVEKPHLDKLLRIWSFENGRLIERYRAKGFSNHAIGDEIIHSGVRDCEGDPAFVVPGANRRDIYAVRVLEGQLEIASVTSLEAGLDCAR